MCEEGLRANALGCRQKSLERKVREEMRREGKAEPAHDHLLSAVGLGEDIYMLIVETVAEFHVDLARVVPVKAAEGDAVVEFDAAVGEVDGVE